MSNIKILSYEEKGGYVVVTTDYAPRPSFAYSKDKFYSKAALLEEIGRSVRQGEKMKKRKDEKWKKLKKELDD